MTSVERIVKTTPQRVWARPFGEAAVTLHLSEYGPGTRVVIEKDAVSGPEKLVPKPVRAPGLKWRNVETLRRLASIAERRS